MKNRDKLTPELRQAEKEIDNYYKFNPLVSLPFATAAWSFLFFVENYMHYMVYCLCLVRSKDAKPTMEL